MQSQACCPEVNERRVQQGTAHTSAGMFGGARSVAKAATLGRTNLGKN